MSSARPTPAAQRDLGAIWDYAAEQWDVAQAETYVTEIWAAIERVADDPRRGRRCDDVRLGYRRYGVGSHLLCFVERPDGVDVVRILHQRMDPTRHLEGGLSSSLERRRALPAHLAVHDDFGAVHAEVPGDAVGPRVVS